MCGERVRKKSKEKVWERNCGESECIEGEGGKEGRKCREREKMQRGRREEKNAESECRESKNERMQ